MRSDNRAPAGLRSSRDCAVPRLTLLFFGAAKGFPEVAKMVTAGIAPHFEGKQAAKLAPLSSRSAAPDEVHHQGNHRYYQ